MAGLDMYRLVWEDNKDDKTYFEGPFETELEARQFFWKYEWPNMHVWIEVL